MKINLEKADISEKKVIKNLLDDNLRELGITEDYKYLDNYWEEPNRHPFLIKLDGKNIGFIFVNTKDPQSHTGFPQGIAEFYVRTDFRNKGIGEKIACDIFEMFPGKWSIRELDSNKSAQEFWRKVIGRYTNGNFKEIISDNQRWKGPIQLFDNSKY